METEYTPYGDLWKKEMLKFNKKQLIELLSITYKANSKLIDGIKIKKEEHALFKKLEGTVYGNSSEPQTAG